MKYETIPYVDKPVSRILFGTAQSSFLRGEESNAILDAALEAGITTFDTARNYALSEKTIGTWLRARDCRDQIVILSKCAHPNDDGTKRVSEAAIRADFARSTELLGTDYIDIYVLHRDDPDVEVAVPVETLNAMHAEGKIGAFGGSNWTFERIQEANEYAYILIIRPRQISGAAVSSLYTKRDISGGLLQNIDKERVFARLKRMLGRTGGVHRHVQCGRFVCVQDLVKGGIHVGRLIIQKEFELDGAFGEGRVDDKLLTIGERDAGTADAADPGFVRRNGDRVVIMRHDLQIGFAGLVLTAGQHKNRQKSTEDRDQSFTHKVFLL